ncbi:MAG TPA: hypothetical protein VIK24_20600 [Pyrinomonadaceae bacterium]
MPENLRFHWVWRCWESDLSHNKIAGEFSIGATLRQIVSEDNVSEDIFQLSVSILTIANRLLDVDIQKGEEGANAEAYSF